ncbi:hypothetical protein EG329_014432 [Mollisiaceae sp. DMI_Dod_QoI]|nr:hypothetical protein EG329_014432 [Helotiales sp. DMI_Dod_QoI]
MLSNPLTPPNEHSAEATAVDDGEAYLPGANDVVTQPSVVTPVSNANMGLDEPDEMSNMDGRLDEQETSDEDQDMSEGGGAALSLTLSHAEALNAEMDALDAELMGPENLEQLYLDTNFPNVSNPFFDSFQEPEQHPAGPMNQPEEHNDMHMYGPGSLVNLPSAMSAVSLHLQQFQEEQEQAESAEAAGDTHGAIMNNSTPSILLDFLLSSQAAVPPFIVGHGPQWNYISPTVLENTSTGPSPAMLPLPSFQWPVEQSTTPSPDSDVDDVVPMPFPFSAPPAVVIADNASDADQNEVEEPFNQSLFEFLYSWGMTARANEKLPSGPSISAVSNMRSQQLSLVQQTDLEGENCDIQRINWAELGVSRLEGRQMRRVYYKNYQNLRLPHQWHPRLNGARLEDDQNFFRFRRMDFNHDVHLSHFQLRNLIACATRDHVFYATRSKIMQWNPRSGALSGKPSVAMDLTDPIVQSSHSFNTGIQISTLTVAHNILVAGGFCGEYALVNLRLPKEAKHTEGLLTDHQNSITNHVQVHLSRGSSLPLAAFASNDMGMRILDVNTNKFIAEHKYEHAINCTAISPDQRLRVMVGDTRQVMICNSETGEVLQSLGGHRDYGFACDWADDGWTVATGNQDMQVKIWDARKWTSSQGQPQPVATIAAEMAGVRKLKFSPIGSGKRVLLAAEPADIVSVIDAQSFTSKQTLSFFGEIGGIDFTNGGRDLLVANCDSLRGGIMEFERCDFAGNDSYGLDEIQYTRRGNRTTRTGRFGDGYDWLPDDEVVEHPKAYGTRQQRIRKAASLGVTLPFF